MENASGHKGENVDLITRARQPIVTREDQEDVLAALMELKREDIDAYVREWQRLAKFPVQTMCGHSFASYNVSPDLDVTCDECGGFPAHTPEGDERKRAFTPQPA